MTNVVRARIDDDLKDQAVVVLAAIGLTISDAVRILLTRIAKEGALPIELVTPNAATIAAMEEGRKILNSKTKRFKNVQEMFSALEAETGADGN